MHAEMENGAADNSARAAGGMCDRLLTFLAKNLSMNRQKAVTEGPRNGGGHYHQEEGEREEEEEEEDEYTVRIERADFDLELGDHGNTATTILEDVSTVAATASDEQRQKGAAAAVEEIMKVRKTVTIKDDRPEDTAATGEKGAAAALERKKSMFKKRQAASSSGGGGEEQGGWAPRRTGLRPRMQAVLRVASNIDERSSTHIEERKRSFGGNGKPVPDK
ncbi:uncharacterized protein LOC133887116 [Phragmites australis]|uniref:uncharacterized protein LOC133887116 n=1 Tax=Phragmites australis TaxID=29695 RepID=UPI002D771DCF|nr:uncharacterized protein LOC133887116 [Phragmites australis]